MSNRSVKLFTGALVALGVGAAIAFSDFNEYQLEEPTSERVAFLMTEMTTSASRQQEALDELVRMGDPAIVYLFSFLHDRRALATRNVRFLNTQSSPIEKYFLTLATTVDELTLRYVCWKTKACDFGFDEKNRASWELQLSKLAADCPRRYPEDPLQCRAITASGRGPAN
jgi:hypothetical protein